MPKSSAAFYIGISKASILPQTEEIAHGNACYIFLSRAHSRDNHNLEL